MLGIDFNNKNFTGGFNSVQPTTDSSAKTPVTTTPKEDSKTAEKQQVLPEVNGDVVVVPERSSAVVYVRSDKQNYKRKILDFAEDYSRVLAVTFGVSAFLFNLGSTTVLNKRSLIWSGMAVVVVVVAFLVYHDREKIFGNTQLATK